MNNWQTNVIVISFTPKEIYQQKVAKPTADQSETRDGGLTIRQTVTCNMTWGRVNNNGFDMFWIYWTQAGYQGHLNLNIFYGFTFLKIYLNTNLVFEYSVDRTNIRLFEYSLTSLEQILTSRWDR